MSGYLKFTLIIAIGAFLFDDPLNYQQVISIIIVMAGNVLDNCKKNNLIFLFFSITQGLILYSYLKINENKANETKPIEDAEKALTTSK